MSLFPLLMDHLVIYGPVYETWVDMPEPSQNGISTKFSCAGTYKLLQFFFFIGMNVNMWKSIQSNQGHGDQFSHPTLSSPSKTSYPLINICVTKLLASLLISFHKNVLWLLNITLVEVWHNYQYTISDIYFWYTMGF